MAVRADVAVIVPVFNPRPTLRDALESVIAQSLESWELLLVDDGSAADLGWAAALDPRITVLRVAHGGVSAARNRGVASTTAPWLAFLDDDDTWSPRKLERQLETLAAEASAFSHTAFEWVQTAPSGESTTHIRSYPAPLSYAALLRADHVCTSSVVLARTAFEDAGGFRTELSHAEDLDLWLRLLRAGIRPSVVDEPLVRYTTHAAGASNDYARTYRARTALLRDHLRSARVAGAPELVEAACRGLERSRELASYQAFDAARASSSGTRFGHLARSVRLDPRVAGSALVHELAPRRKETL